MSAGSDPAAAADGTAELTNLIIDLEPSACPREAVPLTPDHNVVRITLDNPRTLPSDIVVKRVTTGQAKRLPDIYRGLHNSCGSAVPELLAHRNSRTGTILVFPHYQGHRRLDSCGAMMRTLAGIQASDPPANLLPRTDSAWLGTVFTDMCTAGDRWGSARAGTFKMHLVNWSGVTEEQLRNWQPESLTALTGEFSDWLSELDQIGTPAAVNHPDLKPDNFIVRTPGKHILLDWDGCSVGHPLLSVLRLPWGHERELWQGYPGLGPALRAYLRSAHSTPSSRLRREVELAFLLAPVWDFGRVLAHLLECRRNGDVAGYVAAWQHRFDQRFRERPSYEAVIAG